MPHRQLYDNKQGLIQNKRVLNALSKVCHPSKITMHPQGATRWLHASHEGDKSIVRKPCNKDIIGRSWVGKRRL